MIGKPRLLLITPVVPAERGNGLAMRAGLFLEALAAEHAVFLLVVPIAEPAPPPRRPPAFLARHAARTVILDLAGRLDSQLALIQRVREPSARAEALREYPRPLLSGAARRDTVQHAAARFADVTFDLVHVMRLYLAPFAEPWLGTARSRCILDLDDDEVQTRRRLAAIHARRGDAIAASRETLEAERYDELAGRYLHRFHRVLVSAFGDRTTLEARHGLRNVVTVPNAVRLPDAAARRCPAPKRLLFVGSLAYAPNADAARVLCEEILPHLREGTANGVEVQIVGSCPPAQVASLADLPGVSVAADVPSVDPYYQSAGAAVVPIRAGGGVRIKVLEAFAQRCPVVSTRMGAEGIRVRDGVDLLLADEPRPFAEACLRLLRDDELARRLSESAATLVASRYAFPVVAGQIAELCRELRAG